MNRLSVNKKHDKFFEETAKLADKGRCEGGCSQAGECCGDVSVRRVVSLKEGACHDWGWFSYCTSAVSEEEIRGFTCFTEDQWAYAEIDRVAAEIHDWFSEWPYEQADKKAKDHWREVAAVAIKAIKET